jgi:hypothetical protein
MQGLIVAYFLIFAGAGAWSILFPESDTTPAEAVAEAGAFVVLGAGVLLFLLRIDLSRDNRLWLLAVGSAIAAMIWVIGRDRQRTLQSEGITRDSPGDLRRMVLATDLLTAALFAPALCINVLYALR